MRLHPVVLAVSIVCSGAAAAAEYWSGNYVVGGGVGGVECRQFVSVMNLAESRGVGTTDYLRATYNFDMYVAGFRTAYNLQTPDTCDIFGSFRNDQLMGWLKYYCQTYPTQRFGSAVVALAQGLYPGRVAYCQR